MFCERINKIQKRVDDHQAFLVLNPANRFYLTGFSSSDGFLLITSESSDFYTDFRYFESAAKTVSGSNVHLFESWNVLRELTERLKISEVFIEPNYVTCAFKQRIETILAQAHVSKSARFEELVFNMRSIKTDYEISLIKKAQKITDDTFEYIIQKIAIGKTERDIALDMEFYLRSMGSEGVSFDFIVVSGRNSSLPHGVPQNKKIESGDFVTMDFGAVCGGYRSDMTRTVAVGSVSAEQREVYNTVISAQNAAFAKINPGVECRIVDKAARDVINKAGYGGCFGHGLGHSVGIDIHESPCFNTTCTTLAAPGMVITVEPGIYIKNKYGVRIEDMVLITENGFENFTKSSKELLVL